MVFKPINLARQSIVKTFTHGYAQSLVAATQSSSASHNTPFQTLGNKNALGSISHRSSSSQSSIQQQHFSNGFGTKNAKLGQSDAIANSSGTGSGADGGLTAYYAAWQKHQKTEEDQEWHQFQFVKRIGWKAPTTIQESEAEDTKAATTSGSAALPEPTDKSVERPQRATVERARSTSAIDDINRANTAEEAQFEKQRLAKVNEAVAREIQSFSSSAATDKSGSAEKDTAAHSSNEQTGIPSPFVAPTSASDSGPYVEQLVYLAEHQRYDEIPSVFESILIAGVKPTATAYNALLLAAINLPRRRHHVVPKALDVYSDMLKRRVSPNTATYAILIELLAARALEVMVMKKELDAKRLRYTLPENAVHDANSNTFLFSSDETERDILAENDTLSLAIKLFDTSAAVPTNHQFTSETYRQIITACAQHGRIGDMVRIYADMESQSVIPQSAIFSPMIEAFSLTGDLKSAVECYNEYKALAIAHDQGSISIVRKDEEIYAAVVKAYANCDRLAGGLQFLAKVEDTLATSPKIAKVRDAVTVQVILPRWIAQEQHAVALVYSQAHLTDSVQTTALTQICIDAADKNQVSSAMKGLKAIQKSGVVHDSSVALAAVFAMFVRHGDLAAASAIWKQICALQQNTAALIEPSTMYALAIARNDSASIALAVRDVRQVFARIRAHDKSSGRARMELNDRLDEAIAMIGAAVLKSSPLTSTTTSLEIIQMMTENGMLDRSMTEHLLAGFGPNEISSLAMTDVHLLVQVEAGLLAQHTHLDVAHTARLSHLLDITSSAGLKLDDATLKLINHAFEKIDNQALAAKWQATQQPQSAPVMNTPYPQTVLSAGAAPYEDNYDPYGSTTDFKGSAIIAEELEKANGRHASHLNEALIRFKNMRRAGRHPRYVTYAKLINAAAKENRLNLALEILAMARQDVPFLPQSSVVRHGWVSILDALVGSSLTMGHRDLAAQHHQELLNMAAAPSANTFGLYITTLKESTKTFDEATEAVKIFHRAKAEGIEPSSFLYNALIGKLGKARRIDDCLFYFAEMRNRGIRPTSVTYGTIVNALCRVSDDKFAEELFEEMESMPNYKPRPAPYNSLMQYFLTTKRDRSKVLSYYDRMTSKNIQPTMHTYKLLIDTHATLEPVDMPSAEAVLDTIRASGMLPEAVHYASLIHAKGCNQHDLAGARAIFDGVINAGQVPAQPALYQAMFESMVANHDVESTEPLVEQMKERRVGMTAYIANTLIHGWAMANNIGKAKDVYDRLGREKREPSTYEAMVRAFLSAEERGRAKGIVGEALSRGYPAAVAGRICELVGGGASTANLPETA